MFACLIGSNTLDIAREFSPRVEALGPDAALLDLDGLERLFGSSEDVARKITAKSRTLRVGIASNPDAAVCAARALAPEHGGVAIIEAGDEARLLGGLPLELLDPPQDVAILWRLWGLHTFSDLSALPEIGLAMRMGEEGVRWQRRARGVLERALLPEVAAPEFRELMELEYPVAELEPLSFILASLLRGLCATLESHGMAAQELHLRLRLEQGEHERLLRLPFPMRDSKALLKLMQMDLEAHPPLAAIVEVSLEARPAPPRVIQGGLFLPSAPEPQKLEITLARIARLVGADHVGTPEILDTHRPDAFRMVRFAMPPPSNSAEIVPRPTTLALRRFRPALAARVRVADARPVHLFASGIAGAVERGAGPWRTTGDWWRADAWARDEWDVAVGGALYRIYMDLGNHAWFVEGCYD